MDRRLIGPALTIALIFVAGCAAAPPEDSIEVTWDIQSDIDLVPYQSYRWREGANTYSRAFEADGERAQRMEAVLRAAVNRELAEKGYRQVLGESPDFLVSYHVAVFEVAVPVATEAERHREREEEIRATSESPIREIDRATRPELIRRGTLVLYIEDAATGTLAWSGTASGNARSFGEGQNGVQLAVRLLLERFPN